MPRGTQYHKGDAWGCVGAWFAGQWRNPPALGYIAQVKEYLRRLQIAGLDREPRLTIPKEIPFEELAA